MDGRGASGHGGGRGVRGGKAGELEVPIAGEHIELGAFLKWCQAVSSGGEAKFLIQQGRVRVNGEVETRRRHPVQAGDRVLLDDGRAYVLVRRS